MDSVLAGLSISLSLCLSVSLFAYLSTSLSALHSLACGHSLACLVLTALFLASSLSLSMYVCVCVLYRHGGQRSYDEFLALRNDLQAENNLQLDKVSQAVLLRDLSCLALPSSGLFDFLSYPVLLCYVMFCYAVLCSALLC